MKRLIITMILCLALAGAVSGAEQAANSSNACVGCHSDSTNLTMTDINKTTYTFIQEGNGGSFEKDGSGNYMLTITEVVPYTIYFSDRPARMAGFAPMDKFLNGFCFGSSNPPNAAVLLKDGEEDSDMIVVELTSPNYDETNKTLTYEAKVLDNYTFASNWSQDLLPKADVAIPEKFGRVAIVIDDCPNGDVACCEAQYSWSHCCGTINTGCCWSWSDFTCEACHPSEYTSQCKSKFGTACSANVRDECPAGSAPPHKEAGPVKDKSKEKSRS